MRLKSTGERFLPEEGGQNELEHVHRYLFACSISGGKVVLDIACGEGYGSEMLSNTANKVIGVDISIEAVNHARAHYSKENLEYLVGCCTDIPLPDSSVDMAVSFETIEHNDQHEKMMAEIRRVLRPDGFLVISSPDKRNYSETPGLVNQFHVKELYEQEFKQLINDYFCNVEYLGQRVIFGSCIFSESLQIPLASYVKDHEHIKQVAGIDKPTFWLAIASDARLPVFASGVFENSVNELDTLKLVLADRDSYIAHLNQTIAERDGQIATLHNSTKKALQLYRREGLAGIKRDSRMVATNGYDRNDYAEWIRRYDTLTDESRTTMHARINGLAHQPIISVMMPTYNPKPEWLIEAIKSVRNQIYPHWELCIADDASTDKVIRPILQRYAKEDSRIKVVFREKNGHISAASNSALDLVNGEYVALLDNDDLLNEHALFWVVDAIASNPDARLIYSDEDKVDQAGRRYSPYFKPDWNPDLFLSQNMIGHLGVYRTDLVKKLGGFREGYEGAQDYDLALRCTEQLSPQQIVHIPRVLYHGRSHPGSTAQAGSEKKYALVAGERALNDHFSRIKVAAKAELLDLGVYRARYTIPTKAPLVSLIIPTRNGLALIKQCIDSIFAKTTYKNYEILIVDNNSDEPDTLAYFASLADNKRIRVLRDERPFNYSALNNAAVWQARGEYLGLINNDIEVISPEWLDEMMGLAIQPGVGAVGARLWYPNDTLQHGGVITGLGGLVGYSHKHLPRGWLGYFARAQLIQSFSVVTAACLVVKKSIYEEVRGLDETNLKVSFNDVDFCLRVRETGYRNVWTPYAELYHHEFATRGYDDTPEKQLRLINEVIYMHKRWGNLLMNDPAYSPNLTLVREDFSYAWPPRINPICKSFLR